MKFLACGFNSYESCDSHRFINLNTQNSVCLTKNHTNKTAPQKGGAQISPFSGIEIYLTKTYFYFDFFKNLR
jgi:hypothetical protein